MLNTAGRTRSTLELELAEVAAYAFIVSFSACNANDIQGMGIKCNWSSPEFKYLRRSARTRTHYLKLPRYGMTIECMNNSAASFGPYKAKAISNIKTFIKYTVAALAIKNTYPGLDADLEKNIDVSAVVSSISNYVETQKLSVTTKTCNLAASSRIQLLARKGIIETLRNQLRSCTSISKFIDDYAEQSTTTTVLVGGVFGTCGCLSWCCCTMIIVIVVYIIFQSRFDFFNL